MQTAVDNQHGFRFQQTMLRIRDPTSTIQFYELNFGFKLVDKYDFPQWKFSLYFLAILNEDRQRSWPAAGSPEAHTALWTLGYGESVLELTHNWGTEDDASYKTNNGNVEPYRGFGHVAVMTPDVYAACARLEEKGVRFQKKPDEGRMKGLAFALDPDGYWIEVIQRSPHSAVPSSYDFTLAQTMIRVKDPVASLTFYRDVLKMTLLRECHYGPDAGDFSLYFLAQLPPGTEAPIPTADGAAEFIRCMFPQVIELTHNHGTELEGSSFPGYHNGNDENLTRDPPMHRGFGHTGFLVNNLAEACQYLEENGVKFKKRPEEGLMHQLAFVYDPDGYSVEIVQHGFE